MPLYVEALVAQGHASQAFRLLLDGDLVAAEERARNGVEIGNATDYLRARIRALGALAEVLRAAGRRDERAVLEEAISVAREKESLAHERILRAKLDEIAAQPPATA